MGILSVIRGGGEAVLVIQGYAGVKDLAGRDGALNGIYFFGIV